MARTIMIVDDSNNLRKVARSILEGAGHIVLDAASGIDALQVLSSTSVNMIITDVNMPIMSGLDFCKRVKLLQYHKFTPVLIFSSETSTEMRREGTLAGAIGWLTKPFTAYQLLDAVQKFAR